MELYGPKKRGPKPKTFLLKVRRMAPCACRYCAVPGSEWWGGSLSGPHGGCSLQKRPRVS